jgi:hypothetical protein
VVQTTIVKIEKTEDQSPIFREGDAVMFVIHSPTQSFHMAAKEAEGKVMDCVLCGQVEKEGLVGFNSFWGEIKKPANQAPEPTPTTVTPPAGQEARPMLSQQKGP